MTFVREIGNPQPGFFRLRLVKGGPWVAACIYRPCPAIVVDRAEWELNPDGLPGPEQWMAPARMHYRPLEAEIDGRPAPIERVWIYGREIDYREWRYLTEAAAWDRAYAPDAPLANPRKPIDIGAMPPVF